MSATGLTAKESRELVVLEARNGRGIFAKRNFKAEEIIFEVRGVLVSGDADDDVDEETQSNTYRYDEDRYISPKGRIGDFLNHSCEPNAKVVKRGKKLFVVAATKVLKRSEILMDYSTITAADDIWKMTCNCGTRSCRGTVGKFKLLPKATRERYKILGLVPEHILQIG